jgi:hypothetical protein
MPKKKYFKEDASLETLLDLDGEIFPMDNGYWTKFEARRVHSTEKIPHGIRYSISLHDRNNTRILGFDNAHGYKPKKRNMVHPKLLGITNTRWRKFIITNSNRQVN